MARFLPKLNAVRAFEAAGRRGSFTGAANELNVSHAAISRHVRGLEKQLGVQLFEVVARGVRLTETGRQYLQDISPALEQIAIASEALQSRIAGEISISCEPTFAAKWLMPHLGEFSKAFPNTKLKLDATAALADVQNLEVDVAIRYCSVGPPDCDAHLISSSLLYAYGSQRYEFCSNPRDLLKLPLLNEDDGRLWRKWFDNIGIQPKEWPALDYPFTSLLAIEGALAGVGIALISQELILSDLKEGRLKQVSDIGLEFGGYFLISNAENGKRRLISEFRSWLLDATSDLRE
jgi:DNA-binding transcriptional LysR family regulator